MTIRIFPTAQDAENAFYEALEHADLEAMMSVWAEDEEIVCVHPTGPRLTGQDQVRESWRQIFAGGAGARVQVSLQALTSGVMFAVHSVLESFAVEGEAQPAPVVATNVYLRTPAGWRMLVHHASPAPQRARSQAQPAVRETPKILH
ncbi:MAG TPA: nuclear transport factor 2 family protein [Burkholderiales bacterium]|nr:nuclear transport factor 2 family protein [Burkholderiales bacterium]